MKLKQLAIVLAGLVIASPTFANTTAEVVAKVSSLQGDVKVESLQGKRSNAQTNMQLVDGSTLIVLKGKVTVKYSSSECEVTYPANTLVSISKAAPCAAGQNMSVGQTAAPGNDDRVRSIWLPAVAAAVGLGFALGREKKSGSR